MSRIRLAALGGLIGFHALLLWQRFADASILEPAVLAKYVGGVLLLAGLYAFERYAPAHLRGRRAKAVFWLLVLVLHAIAPSSDVAILELALVAPLAVAVVAYAAASDLAFRALGQVTGGRVSRVRSGACIPLPARAPPCAR